MKPRDKVKEGDIYIDRETRKESPITKPQLHNPDNLTPEQYGAKDGWRLLYVGENRPHDYECKDARDPLDKWERFNCDGNDLAPGLTYRTRTPDPYAEKDGWIKMSERKPTEADLPVWLSDGDVVRMLHEYEKSCTKRDWFDTSDWTLWRNAKADIPAPPARELTQEEKDEEGFLSWSKKCACMHTSREEVFAAGIAYERAEIAKMLPEIPYDFDKAGHAIGAIRARVKGAQ